MSKRTEIYGLSVAKELFDFIENHALSGLTVTSDQFWSGLADMVHDLGPKNRALLLHREDLQKKIDSWHITLRGKDHDAAAYQKFLTEIGYLVPEPADFVISTQNVDPEIALIPGPQLVVPIMNARYALNAANARWGSLYDALYGTNAMGDLPQGRGYDAARGARVIGWAKAYLDRAAPLVNCSHADVTSYEVVGDKLLPALADSGQYVGMNQNEAGNLNEVILQKNGLHIAIQIDPEGNIGSGDKAHVDDVLLESAVSVIMDCEDSVAAVDAPDKVLAYTNWLGLMRGDLAETVIKGGTSFDRVLNEDRAYEHGDKKLTLKGRALMLVRNVGHLMTNPAITDRDGREIGEGLLDAMCTTMIAMHDLNRAGGNSLHGSVYVVKPKMHGPAEVAFADEIFTTVESILGLPHNTVKLGIMDEERRTSANLKACIEAAQARVAFINTGFLDRTGDEIHTSMEAGPMIPKGQMKMTPWINAYEDRNVDIGLACGLQGKAQIGKGMWAMPEEMQKMMKTKIQHLKAGANTSWVPSPVAATLHSIHYHRLNVKSRQIALMSAIKVPVDNILDIPVMNSKRKLSPLEIRHELENNAQGILGYVSRWVGQGVGCSKVPNINDIALMEDCATLRISSQHIANWLHHDVITKVEVRDAMKRMAVIVDRQNRDDKNYVPMSNDFSASLPFIAALDLVLKGRKQANGYTEFILYKRRQEQKNIA